MYYLKPFLKQVSMNVTHFVGVSEACAIIMYYLMSLNGNLVIINQLLPYTSPITAMLSLKNIFILIHVL